MSINSINSINSLQSIERIESSQFSSSNPFRRPQSFPTALKLFDGVRPFRWRQSFSAPQHATACRGAKL